MDKNRKPALLLIALLSAVAMVPLETLKTHHGFLAQGSPTPTPTFTPLDAVTEGTTITIDGAETMAVINQALESGFEGRYAGTNVVTASDGVEDALRAVQSGEIDLAALGRPLTDEELAQSLSETIINREKIAIVVGRDNPFQRELTFEQFVQIFRGEITNWAELGGVDRPIRFIDRPDDSDLRLSLANYSIFKQAPFATGSNATQVEEDSTAAVVRELGDDGISYAIASEVVGQNAVRPLAMDGALPSETTYPFSQPRGYVYYGEPSLPVQAFLGFANSPEGQQAVAEARQTEKANVTAGAEQLPGAITIAPDGQYMVRGNEAGQLEWLDADGTPTNTVVPNAHQGVVTAVAISPDGQTVVSAGADGMIRRWDRNANPIGEPISASTGPVMSLAISPDGQTLVNGNASGTIQRWSMADGTPLGDPIPAHEGPVKSISYPAGGQNFFTGGGDGNLGFWNADGTPAGKANAHKGGVTNVVTTPDGQTLVTTGSDGTIRQWERATLQPKGETIAAHDASITSLAISPDGNTIATAAENNTLQLWEPNLVPRTPEPLLLDSPASSLGFTPDGELVTGRVDGQVERRNDQGEVLATTGGESTGPGLDLSGWTDRLQNLPRNTWWLLALIPLLLILAGLLGALFGLKDKSKDEEDEEDLPEEDLTAEVAPGAGADIDFSTLGAGAAATAAAISVAGAASQADATSDQSEAGLAFVEGGTATVDAALPPEAALIATAGEGITTVPDNRLGDARAELDEGKRLMADQQYESALTRFNQAVEITEVERLQAQTSGGRLGGINALSALALAQRGNALAMLGQASDAMESYNNALEIDSSAIDAWIGKGKLLTGLGRYEEALFCFDTALEMDDSAAQAWVGKGQALLQMGRQAEAEDCFARARALGVEDIPAAMDLGPVYESALDGDVTPTAIGSEATVPGYNPDIPAELHAVVSGLPSEDMILLGDNPDEFDVPPDLAADIAQLPSQAETVAVAGASLGAVALGTFPHRGTGQITPAPTTTDEVIEAAHLPLADDLEEMQEALQAPGLTASELAGASPAVTTEPDWTVPPLGTSTGIGVGPTSPEIPTDQETTAATSDTPHSWITLSMDNQQNRFYVVWQLDPADQATVRASGGETLAIRLYDVTGQATNAPLSTPAEEQRCQNDEARDWYLTVPQWDRIYLAEVGYLTAANDWYGIVRSQAIPAVAP
jgi:ABC-type phosphate transport system substrate-binding protein/tetratricopeptide (TPR) repeat protein